MFNITLNNLGKKFNREWIFRNLNREILSGENLVILGGNGSGKSTLLQTISGFISPTEGTVIFKNNNGIVTSENAKDFVSIASPYLQLLEDFTLEEMLEHAAVYKPYVGSLSVTDVLHATELKHAKHKYIKQFSSGMKQRLKLGLAILADTPLLLLDEPTSNLDKNAVEWYKQLVASYTKNRTVIVCSNAISEDYFFCDKQLDVGQFKPGVKG